MSASRPHDDLPEAHRQVIRPVRLRPPFRRRAAAEVGEGMTEANVHQISSRYQRRLKSCSGAAILRSEP